MKIIILGYPGVGKGTIAKKIEEKFSIHHISVGDLLKKEARKKTKEGKIIKKYISKGMLVPDELVNKVLLKFLKRKKYKSYILDGYPRRVEQAIFLEEYGIHPDIVFLLKARKKVIIQRLSGRLICRKCGRIYHIKNMPPKNDELCDVCKIKLMRRIDDNPEAIKERFKETKKELKPLIKFYKRKKILYKVNANKKLETYLAKMVKIIENFKRKANQ